MTGTTRSGPDSPVPADGFDPRSVPVRDAATVMVVRDGAEGLEVFMLRRTLAAVFAGGMFVFPGGAVDDADRSPDVESWCDGLDDRQASRLLAVGEGGLGFWIAAIRECFEEAGVLLARGAMATSSASTIRLSNSATWSIATPSTMGRCAWWSCAPPRGFASRPTTSTT